MKHFYMLCLAFMAIGFSHSQSFIDDATSNRSLEIQRVRLNLETPSGYIRQLLLGFTPDNAATDAYDYGYDALNNDNYEDDFGWMIENDAYIIQGVGSFSEDKFYPIGMFLSNSGEVTLSLHSLENFEGETNVFIYDTLIGDYKHINEVDLITYAEAGAYNTRFFITFRNDFPVSFWTDVLSVETPEVYADVAVFYNKTARSLKIKAQAIAPITKLKIYDVLGKEVITISVNREAEVSLPTLNLINGIYIIKLTTTKGTLSKKIIIS